MNQKSFTIFYDFSWQYNLKNVILRQKIILKSVVFC